MKKESLEKAIELIIKALEEGDIEIVDKTELMLNEYQFLHKDKYEKNVKVLQKHIDKR
jgi:hypothetical protein